MAIAGNISKETEVARIKEIISTLPQDSGWKAYQPFCLYQGYWQLPDFVEGAIFAQQYFKPQPGDIFICSSPKTGTTWLKALSFATITRTHFKNNNSDQNPLLRKVPHDCIPFLEKDFMDKYMMNSPSLEEPVNGHQLPLWSTHLSYAALPRSIIEPNHCKIVYTWRDPKDVFVSLWHFMNKINGPNGVVSLEEGFELFCKGVSYGGPYWDHVVEYWKASLEHPDRILFLKYEEMMEDPAFYLKKLANFIRCPFSSEEEHEGEVEKIVELCSFGNLSNLEVNKSGKHRSDDGNLGLPNNVYFRTAKVGDWENCLTSEMGQKLDKIMEDKLSGAGLI